jgi:hypothetical protein
MHRKLSVSSADAIATRKPVFGVSHAIVQLLHHRAAWRLPACHTTVGVMLDAHMQPADAFM